MKVLIELIKIIPERNEEDHRQMAYEFYHVLPQDCSETWIFLIFIIGWKQNASRVFFVPSFKRKKLFAA